MTIKAFSVLFEKKSHEDTHSILNFTVNNKTPGYTKRKEKNSLNCFFYASIEIISTTQPNALCGIAGNLKMQTWPSSFIIIMNEGFLK